MRSAHRIIPSRSAPLGAILLALALAISGCAVGGSPHAGVTPSASAQASPAATATSASAAWVCANLAGSSARYAYNDASGALYLVQGCSTPRAVAAPAGRQLAPLAFSPTSQWLLVWNNLANPQQPDTQSCLALVDVGSLAVTSTQLCSPGVGATPGWFSFIGWASDASFYGESTAPDGSAKVLFISLPQQTQAQVTTLTWVAQVVAAGEPAGVKLRGDALYYGGYASASEGGAYLHRFSLTTQTDTRSVRLGLAGTGGCQGTEAPCLWTGPWDISPDGSHIAYHVPGPTQSLTDTSNEPNTPLYLANSDGSGARQLFPGVKLGAGGFNQPAFSPDGRYIVTTFSSGYTLPPSVVFERLSDGGLTTAPAGLAWMSWTAQPGVALMVNNTAPGYTLHLELFNVVTGEQRPLQAGSRNYVWG